jgi:hypothetical protein
MTSVVLESLFFDDNAWDGNHAFCPGQAGGGTKFAFFVKSNGTCSVGSLVGRLCEQEISHEESLPALSRVLEML